jgi:membrane fusion protein (multidrug efflux system)
LRKAVLLTAAVVCVAFVAWRILAHLGPSDRGAGSQMGRPPVAVEVAEVTRGPIQDVRLLTGSVLPQYRYLVATKVPGRVIELVKRIGDRVQRDEVIARLDSAEYEQAQTEARANLEIARSSLAAARAELELAQKTLERVNSLEKSELVSDSQIDDARFRFEAQQARVNLGEAQVEQRVAALEATRIRLGYTLLRAAEPGYVGERLVDEGALLPVNAAVVSVVGLDTVFVSTSIIERDYGNIRSGQEAQIEVDAFPGRRFPGRVSRLAPVLREESRVAEMEVLVPNPDQALKPGMFARVHVILSNKADAQIVPAEAVVHRDGQTGLFVVEEAQGVARYVPVTLGIQSQTIVEVAYPVLNGARIVTLGQHLLEDGSPILLPSPPPPVAVNEASSSAAAGDDG